MRNKILLVGGVALLAYVVGTRTPRVEVKNRESVGHQLVRLWNDPKAKKQRRKAADRRVRAAEKRAKALSTKAKSTFRELRK